MAEPASRMKHCIRAFVMIAIAALDGCSAAVAPADAAHVSSDAGDVATTADSGTPCGDACVPITPAPRPIAPLSTAIVTSRRPSLRWTLAPGTDGARVEVCRDRSCATVITTIDALGGRAVPSADLPVGVVYWRLRGRAGTSIGTATSPTWQFTVGPRTAPVDASSGTVLDVNGDGYADVIVGAPDDSSLAGRAYLYLGSATDLPASPTTRLIAPAGSIRAFGVAVASAGDVNGDGFADVIVGSEGGNRVYVFPGSATGISASPATTLSIGDGTANAGSSLASAGDVNGDGYADVIVGTRSNGQGRALLYLGSAIGLSGSPLTLLTGRAGPFAMAVPGPVASAGDVNADGYADVIAGGNGSAYLYLGSETGLSASPTMTIVGPDQTSGWFGGSFSAGDVNGDGYADLIVSDAYLSNGRAEVYVYLGNATGLPAAPVTTLAHTGNSTYFGRSVASLGDVDGDGFADLIVGEAGAGRVYLYPGSAMGIPAVPATTLSNPDGAVDFGDPVASAGDVNGDGYADVIVAAHRSGRVYIYAGGATGLSASPAATLIGPEDSRGRFGISVARGERHHERVLHRMFSWSGYLIPPSLSFPMCGV